MKFLKEARKKNRISGGFWMFFILTVFITILPTAVMANPIVQGIDWVAELLTNGIARSFAIVAIGILGYMAWMGRITLAAIAGFIIGIIFVFGGAAIVDLISTSVGGGAGVSV